LQAFIQTANDVTTNLKKKYGDHWRNPTLEGKVPQLQEIQLDD
jgi:hypothetical protein